MKKLITTICLLLFLSFSLSSCMIFYKRFKDGDVSYSGRKTPITAELIARLVPGESTEEEVKQVFDYKYSRQRTYRNRLLKKVYRDKEYTVDRVIIVNYVPNTVEDLGAGVRRYGWTDRIYLAAFFYQNILQFYTVTHDTKDEKGKIIWGPLDTGGNSKSEFYPGVTCDIALYDVFELGEKKRRYGDSYTEIFQKCGIPEEEYKDLLKE